MIIFSVIQKAKMLKAANIPKIDSEWNSGSWGRYGVSCSNM